MASLVFRRQSWKLRDVDGSFNSVRLILASLLSALKREFQHNLTVYLRLNVLNDETNLTREKNQVLYRSALANGLEALHVAAVRGHRGEVARVDSRKHFPSFVEGNFHKRATRATSPLCSRTSLHLPVPGR